MPRPYRKRRDLVLPVPASPPVLSIVVSPTTSRLRVLENYAFYDDDGAFKAWPEGVIVDDRAEVDLLLSRAAPVERIES